jgi:AcrR family transcriptional regulator
MSASGPPQASRRRQQADSTHRALLDAAREAFEELGYRATTIRVITARAKVAQGTFYIHFENKEDAFGQVLTGVWRELYEMVGWEWEGDPREITRSAVRSVLGVVATHPGLSRALLEGALESEIVERWWITSRTVLIERIAELIGQEQEAGRARAFDPLLAAHALGSMAEWTALSRLALPPEGNRSTDVDAMVDSITDLWYHAIYGAAAD